MYILNVERNHFDWTKKVLITVVKAMIVRIFY